MMKVHLGGAAVLIAAVALIGWVKAQEEGAPRRAEAGAAAEPAQQAGQARQADAARQTDQRQQGQQQGQQGQRELNRGDWYLATCLLIGNQKEAALGQFAQKRAESEEVRQFAEKMAQEHQQGAETLKRFAVGGGIDESGADTGRRPSETGAQDSAREGARKATPEAGNEATREEGAPERQAATRTQAGADQARTGQADQGRTGQAGQAGQGGQRYAMFFVNLDKELAEQCLQSAQKELGAKKGEDFDKCYMISQVIGHQAMLDKLTVFEKHAQGADFKAALAQAKPMVQAHLDEAKAIAKKLEEKASTEQASKSK